LREHVELGCAFQTLHVVSVAGVETRDRGHPEAAWVSTERDDWVAPLVSSGEGRALTMSLVDGRAAAAHVGLERRPKL
jgi:hypothetical protein